MSHNCIILEIKVPTKFNFYNYTGIPQQNTISCQICINKAQSYET